MNISITGTLGSGKSSVCRLLCEKGFEIVSNGVLFRELAAEKGVSVIELNKMAETDKSIDKMLDERSVELGKTKDNTVFDARMGWHFVPDSYKVFLLANVNEAANRVFNDTRVSEEYASVEKAKEDLMQRQMLEKERYMSLYEVDYLDLSNYDLVIESTSASPEEVADKILEYFKKNQRAVLLNPTSIYPVKNMRSFDEQRFNDYISNADGRHFPLPDIAVKNNSFAVIDGHLRILADIVNKEIFVNVNLVQGNGESVAEKRELQNFENIGHFQYKFYPEKDMEYLSFEERM